MQFTEEIIVVKSIDEYKFLRKIKGNDGTYIFNIKNGEEFFGDRMIVKKFNKKTTEELIADSYEYVIKKIDTLTEKVDTVNKKIDLMGEYFMNKTKDEIAEKFVKDVENFGCLLHSIATEGEEVMNFYENLAKEKIGVDKAKKGEEKTVYESNGIKITIESGNMMEKYKNE